MATKKAGAMKANHSGRRGAQPGGRTPGVNKAGLRKTKSKATTDAQNDAVLPDEVEEIPVGSGDERSTETPTDK